jgi:hypothetical protein
MNDYKVFLEAMSVPRVQSYASAFKTTNDRDLLGAYLWGQAIAASLTPFMSISPLRPWHAAWLHARLPSPTLLPAKYPCLPLSLLP